MKYILYILLTGFIHLTCMSLHAQTNSEDSLTIDSLKKVLHVQNPDTNKVNTLIEISQLYLYENKTDLLLYYADEGLALSIKINYPKGEGKNLFFMGFGQSDEIRSFDYFQRSLNIYRKIKDDEGILSSLNVYSQLYEKQKDFRKSLDLQFEAENICIKLNDSGSLMMLKGNIGLTYHSFGKLDSSEIYIKKAYELGIKLNAAWAIAWNLRNMGTYFWKKAGIRKPHLIYMKV